MPQLTILAFFRAKPGRTQALGTALSALVDPTRAEPECLNYDLHQSPDCRRLDRPRELALGRGPGGARA